MNENVVYKPIIDCFTEQSLKDYSDKGIIGLFGFAIMDYLAIKQVDVHKNTYEDLKKFLGDDMLYAICLDASFNPDDLMADIEAHPASLYIVDYNNLVKLSNYEELKESLKEVDDQLGNKYYNTHSYECRMSYCVE